MIIDRNVGQETAHTRVGRTTRSTGVKWRSALRVFTVGGGLIALFLWALMSITPGRAQSVDTPTPTADVLTNLTYTVSALSGEPIRLSDGVFDDPERGVRIELNPDLIAVGDLDGDGLQDASVLLTTTVGDSSFIDLAAVVERNGQLVNPASLTLGDRVRANSVTIDEGRIRVALLTHAPSDLICCPTLPAVRAYRLRNDQLTAAPVASVGRLFPHRVGGRYGYVDMLGQLVVPAELVFAGEFSEGLALISYDGQKFGFIDQTGQVVIPPDYLFATPFSTGLAVAAIRDEGAGVAKAIFINRKGENIFGDQTFPFALAFSEGLAAVKDENGRFGFINAQGDVVIPPQFDYALSFAEGVAPVLSGDKVGYINRSGQMIVEPQFDSAFDFQEVLAAVTIGGQSGYIDHSGQLIIPLQFDLARSFRNGLAAVKLGENEAFIDHTGAIIIDAPDFTDAHDFSEGLAAVKVGGLYGYLSERGEMAIPPQFTQAGDFQQGVAIVETADLWGLIGPDGGWLLQIDKPTPAMFPSFAITSTESATQTTSDGNVGADGLNVTEIIYFTPSVSPETRTGACIANSEIIPLPTAWRCGVNNEIFDPCLTAADGATIVCGVDPAGGLPGFNMLLDTPLPPVNIPQHAFPGALLFQLENGAICRWNSGATIQVDGRKINYVCSDLTQLLGEVDQSGSVWAIEEVTLSNDGQGVYRIESSRPIRITRVWQPE